jgi:5-formyltetrahydrofolate cyclo-ligase
MNKAEMRRRMTRILAAVEDGDLKERSRRVAERFARTDAWTTADTVLCFLSMPHELRTGALIGAARAGGKRVAVPRIEGEDIRFLIMPDSARGLPRDRWGIPVPSPDWPALALGRAGRVLVAAPGLAFDRQGNRIGRGKGYYDRFLAGAREETPGITAIGVCLSEQVVEAVPHGARDERLDGVVTESETIIPARS